MSYRKKQGKTRKKERKDFPIRHEFATWHNWTSELQVGVKNKTEVQAKLTNVILVDANRNQVIWLLIQDLTFLFYLGYLKPNPLLYCGQQVKSPTIPQLPQHRELYSCLSPYHAKLVEESYLGKKRPVYECTDVQVIVLFGFTTYL